MNFLKLLLFASLICLPTDVAFADVDSLEESLSSCGQLEADESEKIECYQSVMEDVDELLLTTVADIKQEYLDSEIHADSLQNYQESFFKFRKIRAEFLASTTVAITGGNARDYVLAAWQEIARLTIEEIRGFENQLQALQEEN